MKNNCECTRCYDIYNKNIGIKKIEEYQFLNIHVAYETEQFRTRFGIVFFLQAITQTA